MYKPKGLKTQLYLLIAPLCLLSCKENNNAQRLFYYENGQVKAIKGSHENTLNGTSVWFYPNGKVEQIQTFINGETEGHAYYFYESGALKARELHKNGKTVGYAESFYDHSIGMHEAIRRFDDSGKLVFIRQFDTSGKIIREEGVY